MEWGRGDYTGGTRIVSQFCVRWECRGLLADTVNNAFDAERIGFLQFRRQG